MGGAGETYVMSLTRNWLAAVAEVKYECVACV